jgi:multiple sugar transport system permease protein
MTAPARDLTSRRGWAHRLRRELVGWSFALPWVVLFALFLVIPVVVSLLFSFTDIGRGDLRHPLAVNVIGVANYTRLLGDELFVKAAVNTAIIVAVGLPLTMALGLAAALGINSELVRFKGLFRVGYYLPYVTTIVAVAVVWRFVYERDAGLLNGALRLVGIDGPNWLASTTLALPALIVMIAWRGMGFQMLIFLAGLQAIPKELYEAARIDGATRWQQFRHVTLPALRPTLLFGGVVATIAMVLVFEEPMVMTAGGPLNSTLSVSQYVYKQFGFGNYGYASAMSYTLFVAIALLSIVWFRVTRTDD